MSLFSDIVDELTGKNLSKAYNTDYTDVPKDEVIDSNKAEEPSNVVKVSAILTALLQKSLGPTLKTAKKKIKKVVIDQKNSFISGALAATLLLGGAGLIKQNVNNRHTQDQIREKILETLVIDNDSLILNDKNGKVILQRDDDGSLYEVVNGERKDIKEINPKKVTVDQDNTNRYEKIFAYGTNPYSEPVKAYARQIVNAALNSGISPEIELRRFLTSFVERTELQDDKSYNDFITSIITSFMNSNNEPKINDIKDEIEEKGIESIYGGNYESHSPRR